MPCLQNHTATGPEKSAVHGDLDAYARTYSTALTRYFGRRGAQRATAEDLVQEVFVRLASRVAGGEIENPQGYLMQTAASVWSDFQRRRRRRRHSDHVEYEDALHAPEAFSPERVLEGKEAVQWIVDALRALPARTRHIYMLCRIEGMKRREVGARLGITPSAVDKHLMRATKHIGVLFGEF